MVAPAYTFGPFVLDPADRRLLRDGAPVEVTARYFDALLLLVGESGRLVSKERFHDQVWSGIPVTDEALTQCIRTLRRALGDDAAAPQFIETVPRHGYRFVAPVEARGEAHARDVAANSKAPSTQVTDIAAAALGGAAAGVVGALGYLTLGLAGPGIGTASTLLVLVSLNLLLGLLAGAAVGAGIVLLSRRGGWVIAGGALGGLLVGAVGRMIGNDLFELFFGRSPGAVTGAYEGLLLGAATGLGAWLALKPRAHPTVLTLFPGYAAGGVAGLLLALTGGGLMAGSLATLAGRFPATRLRFEQLDPAWLAAATVIEASLFAGSVAAALALARRMRR